MKRNKIKDFLHRILTKLLPYPILTILEEPREGDSLTIGKMKAVFKKVD